MKQTKLCQIQDENPKNQEKYGEYIHEQMQQ